MSPAVRGVVGVILGCLTALAITFVVESLKSMAFPPPSGLDLADPASARVIMDATPKAAFAMVLGGWFAGTLAGAWVAARFSHPVGWPPLTVGIILLAAAVMNMYVIPHPVWFWIIGVAIYPVATWVGAKLGGVPVVRG